MALCLAVKDHHWDIVEWLDWHLAIGVDYIYVFDMGSAGEHVPEPLCIMRLPPTSQLLLAPAHPDRMPYPSS